MQNRRKQAGFALLLIYAMAASVAVMLYLEMPRLIFQAQRQREQLLIDRGEQYRRAIQLYVRQLKKYPARIEELEKTNEMRFLRRRYRDPLTGKDEWRLIHIDANGVFTDSLVHQAQPQTEEKAAGPGIIGALPFVGQTPQSAAPGAGPAAGAAGVALGMRASDRPAVTAGYRLPEGQLPPNYDPTHPFPGQQPPSPQPQPGAGEPNPDQPPWFVGPVDPNQPEQQDSGEQPGSQPPGQPDPSPQPAPWPGQQPGQPVPGQQPGQTFPIAVPGVHAPGQIPPGSYPPGYQPPGGQPVQIQNPQFPGQPPIPMPGHFPGPQPVPVPGQFSGRQTTPGQQVPGQQQQSSQPAPVVGGYYGFGASPQPPASNTNPAGPYPQPYPSGAFGSSQPFPQPVQGAFPPGMNLPGTPPPPSAPGSRAPASTPGQGGAQSPAPGVNQAADLIRQILTNPRPGGAPPGVGAAGAGQVIGGGIAGVATTIEDEIEGIKVYKERSKYREWEFIYDMREDKSLTALGGLAGGGQQPGQGQSGQQQPGLGPGGTGAFPGGGFGSGGRIPPAQAPAPGAFGAPSGPGGSRR